MKKNRVVGVLNGNVNSFLRVIFIALLLGLFSFLFYQATNAPSVFATKTEVKNIQVQMDNRLGRIESGIDDINKYLRE
jgi:hypothetical protein